MKARFRTTDPKDFDLIKALIEDFMLKCLHPNEHAVKHMFNKLKQTPYTWDSDTVIIPAGGGMRPHPWDNDPWD